MFHAQNNVEKYWGQFIQSVPDAGRRPSPRCLCIACPISIFQIIQSLAKVLGYIWETIEFSVMDLPKAKFAICGFGPFDQNPRRPPGIELKKVGKSRRVDALKSWTRSWGRFLLYLRRGSQMIKLQRVHLRLGWPFVYSIRKVTNCRKSLKKSSPAADLCVVHGFTDFTIFQLANSNIKEPFRRRTAESGIDPPVWGFLFLPFWPQDWRLFLT